MYVIIKIAIIVITSHFFCGGFISKSAGIQKRGCIKNASLKCPDKNSLKARVIPQAGHGTPIILYRGQLKAPERIIKPKIKIIIYFFIGILYSIFLIISREKEKIVTQFSATIDSNVLRLLMCYGCSENLYVIVGC